MPELLSVQNLKTYFNTEYGLVKAVNDVSFHINDGEIVGLVGESGCGKSVSILSIMQLVQSPPGEIVGGKIMFDGKDLLQYRAKGPEMRSIRGSRIAMIFQEPMTSLNPVLTICRQMTEALELHMGMNRKEARERAIELLNMVGVPDSASRVDDYPHQFSGGMRQRVMIAMALSCKPDLIIADEPTTALDVTTQAQLLELMTELVRRLNTSMILVTHNLGVVARYAHRIYVMYAGRIVESGPSEELFENPRHPYTLGLLNSVPRLGKGRCKRKLVPIPGMPPNLINISQSCAFSPRCKLKTDDCISGSFPLLTVVGNQHYVACHIKKQEL